MFIKLCDCNALQHTAIHCNTLQLTATHCNSLLTHCNTLQHTRVSSCVDIHVYGVASVSRIDKITGLFCKRALQKRRYSAKETYNLIDPTDRSHLILLHAQYHLMSIHTYIHAYIHIYTHTYTCIYIHICTYFKCIRGCLG